MSLLFCTARRLSFSDEMRVRGVLYTIRYDTIGEFTRRRAIQIDVFTFTFTFCARPIYQLVYVYGQKS